MATINSRLVLVDFIAKRAVVYDKRVPLATYHFVDGQSLSVEDIEWARTEEYKDKA